MRCPTLLLLKFVLFFNSTRKRQLYSSVAGLLCTFQKHDTAKHDTTCGSHFFHDWPIYCHLHLTLCGSAHEPFFVLFCFGLFSCFSCTLINICYTYGLNSCYAAICFPFKSCEIPLKLLVLQPFIHSVFLLTNVIKLGTFSIFKVPMKWNFHLLFYSVILKSMILWFVIFEFGLRKSAYKFFLELQSWPIQVKNVRHSARGQNMQISTFDIIRCVKPSSHHSIWGE